MNPDSPQLECDIVMKGGITSGVVYPGAICELAQKYRFRSIGGTSAGAIAAAATAAAEYGRQHGVKSSFDTLSSLPQTLGSTRTGDNNTFLFHLFQPSRQTQGLYSIFTAALRQEWDVDPTTEKVETETALEKGGRALRAALQHYPLFALIGALPGLVCLVALLSPPLNSLGVLAVLFAACFLIVGLLLGIIVGMLRTLSKDVTQNYLGFCTGKTQATNEHQAFTDWFDDYLNGLSGKPKEEPLTFGNLLGNGEEPNINLQMMTTCLTHGVPYVLPFQTDEFYFKPDELKDFFPDSVVDWMVTHARAAGRELPEGMFALPETKNLPVIVAVRLSMSFPLLFSAVPLYARRIQTEPPVRVWFTDGGVCSNFPLHFFDSPLPRRPTFAINLRPLHQEELDVQEPAEASPDDMVWFPSTNRDGLRPLWRHFDSQHGLEKLRGYFSTLLDTGFTWHETLQATIPGFRDRIIHVKLDKTKDEGGLNLNMPPELIDSLNHRGTLAGQKLVRHYAGPPPEDSDVSWDNHRWVRYRNLMNVLSQYLGKFARAYDHVPMYGTPYRELIKNPPSYAWQSLTQKEFAKEQTEALRDLALSWQQSEHAPVTKNFQAGAPRPEPIMRITANVATAGRGKR